ncbi:MAG TPA: type II CAAX endopeptidase family protein, partial [Euzebya sp.]|nr:type II CAAX endopeptidase family protein [Euzebya sp.]
RLPPVQPDTHDRVPVAATDFEPAPIGGIVRRYTIPWDWWDAIGIYVVWLVLSISAGFTILSFVAAESDEALVAQTLITLVLLIVTTGGWVVLLGLSAGVPDALRRAFGVKRVTGRDLLLGMGYGVGAFVVVQVGLGVAITQLIEATGREVPLVQQAVQEAVRGVSAASLTITFAVAVLAPIGEELLFRGVLYQALAKHLTGLSAISLSGVAFGVSHREPLVIALTFPLGMALAWMLRRHGTLVVPILAHSVFNVIGVVAIRSTGGA